MLPYLLFTFSHLDNRKKTSSQDKSLAPKLILASRKSGVVTQRQEAPEGNRFILVITMVYIRVGNWPTLGFSAEPCLMLEVQRKNWMLWSPKAMHRGQKGPFNTFSKNIFSKRVSVDPN